MSSSVVVVEIDTRKSALNTLFESSVSGQSEQARQFWKTLSLAPHIESSLYSKEIRQQIKPNSLKPIIIDNSRKPMTISEQEIAYMNHLQSMNHMDRLAAIQKKANRIEQIRKMHRAAKEKAHQISNMSRTDLMKSESESKWRIHLNETTSEKLKYNDVINEDDYETGDSALNDEQIVHNLD